MIIDAELRAAIQEYKAALVAKMETEHRFSEATDGLTAFLVEDKGANPLMTPRRLLVSPQYLLGYVECLEKVAEEQREIEALIGE